MAHPYRPNMQSAVANFAKRYQLNGGLLPSSALEFSDYLKRQHAANISLATLRNYSSLIVRWHKDHRYDEHAARIKYEAARTIEKLSSLPKAVNPVASRGGTYDALLYREYSKLESFLGAMLVEAKGEPAEVWVRQDIALLRLMMWTGRSDADICALQRWQVNLKQSGRMHFVEITWPKTKLSNGTTVDVQRVPRLAAYDLHEALKELLEHTEASEDATLFNRPKRNGELRPTPIHPNSLASWLRSICAKSGVASELCSTLTGRTFKRALATYLAGSIPLPALLVYFGWEAANTALPYLKAAETEKPIAVPDKLSKQLEALSLSIPKLIKV